MTGADESVGADEVGKTSLDDEAADVVPRSCEFHQVI